MLSVIDTTTAEKTVLITGNENIQIGFYLPLRRCYLILHDSPSMGRICRVNVLSFDNAIDPQEELSKSITI